MKTNFKVWTVEDIRKVLDEVGTQMGVSCKHVPVLINKRLTRSMGRFVYQYNRVTKEVKPLKIDISGILVSGNYEEEYVKHTIIHEYIHYYTDTTEGTACKHNEKFKANCRKAGIVDDTYTPFTLKENDYKYTITCEKCGATFHRQKLSGGPQGYEKDYRCGRCKGELKVKVNK